MNTEKLKQRCKDEGHALMANGSRNGDIFIYVNPDADIEEVRKSIILLAANIEQLRGE